ncbi:hypothetical protein BDA96_09G266800 [Sorghum bicolor]|uniref:DisA/LigA helix-hairpin-helix motif domain-containing protein n=3 Tax=Sorghum bicolor TaxID=4558 RepID=A0A921QCV9_SORBI|nr:protein PARTING DANCERS [Sorghum bicolor]KAG0519467.1 hypothetical protein BDA96_09G266800 [Sorghum bicolor]KXG22650.1 hypothetical protein SORBI_3009G251700 [Sorghum bicolor]|eukprot:XP_002441608.2 protein PARTING DANCERS [Sorghum bicolor]
MSGRPPPYARFPARRHAFAGDEHPTPGAMLGLPPPLVDASAGRGVCMMSTSWRDKQRPDLVNFIATFLATNLYRLNFLSLSPDFLFNNGGLSVAFIFETDWLPEREAAVFSRVNTLKRQFKYLYVVVVVRSAEQNESFNQSYFKYDMELGCPTFVPVCDPEMGFEKIVRIAHARGVCKQKDLVTAMGIEREQAVQCMDAFLRVLTSIPGIDSHDANALAQAIGSIEAIAKASKEFILENTDLSTEKAERIVRFFRDPQYFLSPKIN